MAEVIIFGTRDTAELAHYYLTHDSPHKVIAFAENSQFRKIDQFKGLPVVDFEDIEQDYPSSQVNFFAPMMAHKMNQTRATIYSEIKRKGYKMISYISSSASVYGHENIGENCFILEDNTVQPFTCIGDNVVLWSGNHIGHHSLIQSHNFFTSHVVLSGHCVVEPYCFFGVNAAIRDGLVIKKGTFVSMSASVIRDTEEWGIYKGSPAQKKEGVLSKDIY